MDDRNDLRAAVDRSRLMVRLSAVGGVLSLTMLILVVIMGVVKESFAGSDVFSLSVIPLSLSLFFAAAALVYGVLDNAAAAERESRFLLERRKDNRVLDAEEDVRFTAGRSFENYRKYAPYVVTVAAALGAALLLFLFYRYWAARTGGGPKPLNALNSALVSSVLMLICMFGGAFFVGQSRQSSFRWLRPLGSWLVGAGGVMLGGAVVSVCNHNQVALDRPLSLVVFWLLGALDAELLLNFVIEFYRPRTLAETRPLFESRLLALFTEPGGVMRNMADALDYQFGFKVSGTWIYGFVERSLFPICVVWALTLWLFTSIHEVGPDEVGIRERFGSVVSEKPLRAGIYFEMPWPFGSINRFSCARVHEIVAGENEHAEDGDRRQGKKPEVILWTKAHASGENNFVVAVEPEGSMQQREDRDGVSVAFLSLGMPVQYRIRESQLMDYAYRNRDPEAMLRHISEQVVTEYLASCSLMHIMSDGRHEAANVMRRRIQKLADEERLGVDVVAVNLLGVHPPVEKVAPAFQEVIGAMEQKEARVLEAKAYAAKILPDAESKARQVVQDAESYRYRTSKVAEAESQRFDKQLRSYQAMPAMFMLNSRLSLLEKDAANARKFILSSSLRNEIYELNFEQKERLDLIDADLGTLVDRKK